MRKIEASDINSAVRGLGMWRMSVDELVTLAGEHVVNPLFASQVIAEAALQVITVKRNHRFASA